MKNNALICCIVLSILAIAGLGYLLYYLYHKKEGFRTCICSGNHGMKCGNFSKLYKDGLTESSNLTALQKSQGGPQWSTVSPGDYNWPGVSKECACTGKGSPCPLHMAGMV